MCWLLWIPLIMVCCIDTQMLCSACIDLVVCSSCAGLAASSKLIEHKHMAKLLAPCSSCVFVVTAGVFSICLHHWFWLVCNTHLSEHRTSSCCCSGACILQLDGVPCNWRSCGTSSQDCFISCLCWWNPALFLIVETVDRLQQL